MLCFDPTRGIDIRTKQQIYLLLRDLAESGAAVLLYTSELKEVQLVCDRAIVIFGSARKAQTPRTQKTAITPAMIRGARICRVHSHHMAKGPRAAPVQARAIKGAWSGGRSWRRFYRPHVQSASCAVCRPEAERDAAGTLSKLAQASVPDASPIPNG